MSLLSGFQPLPPPGGIDLNTDQGKKALDVWISWNFLLVPVSTTQALTLAQLFAQLMSKKPIIWSWQEQDNIRHLVDAGIINERTAITVMPGFEAEGPQNILKTIGDLLKK